ncbi:MAG: 3-deoxy-manno-octulosonate cytidylyltransferase [Rhodobacteraceae bacterium]|nr:MAG: 3-deoxy-manno-octulosonate cytidylyltransferase [Paracoccaceae bacterium]
MRVVVVIPARHASSRFPGKPLVALRGATGQSRTLIRRSWDAATAVAGVAEVIVATDDARIAAHAESFGARVAMTSERCRNGTERCAEALAALDPRPDLVVNLQGDAPLTPPGFVSALIGAMAASDAAAATPVLRCDATTLAHFRDDRRAGRVGGTTAVFDHARRALYFSKEVIPFADAVGPDGPVPVFHHVGLYAYRPEALEAYAGWAPGPLETLEGLEQLRFLENGVPMLCVEVEAAGRVFWELNNPVDVGRIEDALKAMGAP